MKLEEATKQAIAAKLRVAEEYKAKGDFEAVKRVLGEVATIRAGAEAELQIKTQRKALEDGYETAPEGEQDKPVTKAEARAFQQNDPNAADYNANFKPAAWIKGLGPAMQPKWIREAMGSNLKAEAEHYKAAWLEWFRAPNEQAWKMSADPKAIKAMQEGTDNEGGYFVPEEYRTTVIHDTGVPSGVHRPRCTQLTTGLKDGYLPTIGSVTWAAIAEEAAYGDNTPTVGQVSFTIRKAGGTVKVSNELLEDAQTNLPALLAQIFSEARGAWEDEQIIGGDGSTEPEGLRTASITDVLAAGDDVLTIADFTGWYFGLPAQFRRNMAWSTTSGVMADLHGLEVTANKGSLFQTPDEQIMGKPTLLFDGTGWDDAATLAVNEEIGAVGDFRNYYLVDRVGMSLRRDDSIYVANDQVGFFARARMDGVVGLTNAFRIMKMFSS